MSRRFTRVLCLTATLVAFAAPAGADGPVPAREKQLTNILRQECGSCHGMTMKGGLGPALLPENLDGVPNEVLVQIILDGVPETPMPPWHPLLAPGDVAWMVRQLKGGLK
jgi:cytochrome c55X